MNYIAALPPATALPSKLHTAHQRGIPLANGMDCHLVSCSANCKAVMLSMNSAINVLIFTLHLPRLQCHSFRTATATSDQKTIKHHHCCCHYSYNYVRLGHHVGHESSVGIATHYGLDGPGIESRCGRYFPHPSRPAPRPTQPRVQWVPGRSRG